MAIVAFAIMFVWRTPSTCEQAYSGGADDPLPRVVCRSYLGSPITFMQEGEVHARRAGTPVTPPKAGALLLALMVGSGVGLLATGVTRLTKRRRSP